MDDGLSVVHIYPGKIVPVVQAFCYSKYLGYFELNFNEAGDLKEPADGVGVTNANPILLDETITEEPTVVVNYFNEHWLVSSGLLLDDIDKMK